MAANNLKKQYVEDVQSEEASLDIKDFLYMCLAKWRWFVASIFIVLAFAVAYILVTEPTYTRSSQVLIKSDSEGSSISNAVGGFSDLGLFSAKSNVHNELSAISSPSVMMDVVNRLKLYVNYKTDGTFYNKTVYGDNLPLTVQFIDVEDNASAKLDLEIDESGQVTLSDFEKVYNGDEFESDEVVSCRLLEPVNTPIGRIVVAPTLNWKEGEAVHLYVTKNGVHGTAQACQKNLSVSLNSKEADVIDLSYVDVSPQRAVDVLNEIVEVYNEKWIDDKNRVTESTSEFIAERLDSLVKELGDVDENISSYKSQQLLPDVTVATNMYMNQSSKLMDEMLKLNNELSMARYILNYVKDGANDKKLLPVNSGLSNSGVEAQIGTYNEMQLRLAQLTAGNDIKNPVITDLQSSIASTRSAIIASVENLVVTLETQMENLKDNEVETTGRIAANPVQEKYLLSVGRQQKVKEALYLFLLQKREENELSRAFTAYNTRIITPPMGSLLPTAPVKMKILMIAFILGLLLPGGILFLRENMITTVRGRRDLEKLSVPMVGEIPLNNEKKSFWKKNSEDAEKSRMVVAEDSRDIINEAFRVLRTNIEFMSKGSDSNVIVITSFNPGSGKSFIAMNISKSLAIAGKKVLVIDGDMRHASTSQYVKSPRVGLSNYLAGQFDDVKPYIVVSDYHHNLSVLPVGALPPNPTELLEDDRLETMINAVKHNYDYVFIDCPPIDIVADTQIIEKYADRTFFIVRAGLLEKTMLPELEDMYQGNRFKNMSMILNATTDGGGGRYGNRYGYRYGYRYGSHYYAYGSKSKK